MAPIQKTHRRAQKELNELNEWFSDILDDQSHFMRYENVDYPELTFEEANAGWDDQYIDDEYLITHQIENWRRIDLLTEPLTQSDTLPEIMNPRFQRFRLAFPALVGTTTLLIFLPFIVEFFLLFVSTLSSWFLSSEKDYIGKDIWDRNDEQDDSTQEGNQVDENNDFFENNNKNGKNDGFNDNGKVSGDDFGPQSSSINTPISQVDGSISQVEGVVDATTTNVKINNPENSPPAAPSSHLSPSPQPPQSQHQTQFTPQKQQQSQTQLERNQLPHFEKTYYNEISGDSGLIFQPPLDFMQQQAYDAVQRELDRKNPQTE